MATYQLGEMVYKITGDTAGIKKSLGDSEKALGGVKGAFASMSTTAKIALAAVGVGLIAVTKKMVGLASDAAETQQKFSVVFDGISESAETMAKNLARDFGISRQASQDMLSTTGNVLQSVGYTKEASLEVSDTVARLASDLVSFSNSNLSAKEAADVLTKGLLGEREALGSLGFKIMEKELQAYIEAQGKSYAAATQQEKAEATLNIMLEKNKNAIGDYARSFDSVANVSRAIGGRLDDLGVTIGAELLPSLSNLGVAFLNATEDGGVLLDLFKGLAKGAGVLINNIAAIIGYMDMLNKAGRTEDALKNFSELNRQTKILKNEQAALQKQLVGADWTKQIEIKKQLAVLDKEIAKNSTNVNKARIESQSSLEDTIRTGEQAAAALEKETASINKQVTARKNAKKEAPAKKGGGGGKDEFSDYQAEATERYNLELTYLDKLLTQATDSADAFWEAATPIDKLGAFLDLANDISGALGGLSGALADYFKAQNDAALAGLEEQKQAALEAAGVAEETAIEKAQNELDAAKESGDEINIKQKQDALTRAKIEEEYAKKKRKLEYEGQLQQWQFQLASAVATAPLMIMNAFNSGIQAGPFAGPVLAGVLAGIAGATAAVQIAAITASKPSAPKFADGGIVPGNLTTGDRVTAQLNSREMVLNQNQQAELFKMANGAGGGGQPINLTVNIGPERLYNLLFNASKNGELLISDGAVVTR